jgi:hypothetical protein
MVTPLWTAGVSLKTVSVATGSLRCFMLQAGKRERHVASAYQSLCRKLSGNIKSMLDSVNGSTTKQWTL